MSDTEYCTSTQVLGETEFSCCLPAGHPGYHRNDTHHWVGAEGIRRDGSRPRVLPSKPVECHRCRRTYGNLGGGQDSALAAYLTGWTRTTDGGWDCGCPPQGFLGDGLDYLVDDELQAKYLTDQANLGQDDLDAARAEARRLLGGLQ
jgi:hypothetical protein